MAIKRCIWAENNERYVEYHDKEWGNPVRNNDQVLFEALSLEELSDGFSRLIVLERRNDIRNAFENFIPEKLALLDDDAIMKLISNSKIIRHKPKIQAIVSNSRAILALKVEFASLSDFLWGFVGGKPIQNSWSSFNLIPSESLQSKSMSKELQKRKFKRVSSKICYSFMQSVGMVNDHTVDCFRYEEIKHL